MRASVCQIMDGIKAREKDYVTMSGYSGNSRCVKCGEFEASTSLRKKSMFGFIEGGNSWELFTDTAYEVIERRCPKCGHTWEEKPLDSSRNEVSDIAKWYQAIHQPNVEASEKPIDLKKLNELLRFFYNTTPHVQGYIDNLVFKAAERIQLPEGCAPKVALGAAHDFYVTGNAFLVRDSETKTLSNIAPSDVICRAIPEQQAFQYDYVPLGKQGINSDIIHLARRTSPYELLGVSAIKLVDGKAEKKNWTFDNVAVEIQRFRDTWDRAFKTESPLGDGASRRDCDPKQDTPYSFNENNHPWSWFIDGGFAENLVTDLSMEQFQKYVENKPWFYYVIVSGDRCRWKKFYSYKIIQQRNMGSTIKEYSEQYYTHGEGGGWLKNGELFGQTGLTGHRADLKDEASDAKTLFDILQPYEMRKGTRVYLGLESWTAQPC